MTSIDLSKNQLKEFNLSSTTYFTSLSSIYLEDNDLNELENFSISTFPNLRSVGISRNWLSCEYATEFVQQWKAIEVTGDPCDQKKIEKDAENHLIKYVILTTVIILFGSMIAAVWIFRQNALSKTQQINQDTPEQIMGEISQQNIDQHSDSSSHTYEEPIYSEIDPTHLNEPAYNHLRFYPQPLSAILLHYDNLRTSSRET